MHAATHNTSGFLSISQPCPPNREDQLEQVQNGRPVRKPRVHSLCRFWFGKGRLRSKLGARMSEVVMPWSIVALRTLGLLRMHYLTASGVNMEPRLSPIPSSGAASLES
jgi:hypothetical protein